MSKLYLDIYIYISYSSIGAIIGVHVAGEKHIKIGECCRTAFLIFSLPDDVLLHKKLPAVPLLT